MARHGRPAGSAIDWLQGLEGNGMTFWQAVQTCYGKYATFTGRASRSEFWYFVLFQLLGFLACAVLVFVGGLFLFFLFALANFLPSLAVRVRRLHDTDRSGWAMFFALIPIVGPILIIVWDCQPGTRGSNRFGDDPLNDGVIAVFT
jgi:uncharacterized membrane protein YhaH (DUF805 family)